MLIFGKNPVKDLFDEDPRKIKKIYIVKKRHESFYRELEAANVKILPMEELNIKRHFTDADNLQGVVAQIDDPKLLLLPELIEINKDKKNPLILMLDQVSDPHNFGAILRSAAAFEVDGVIIQSRGNASITPTVVKTSAGNWSKVDICEVISLNQSIEKLKDAGYWVVSTSLEATATLDEVSSLDRPLVLIMGNEGKGVRRTIQEKSDYTTKINMSSTVESLNVSTATAIVLHALYTNGHKGTDESCEGDSKE